MEFGPPNTALLPGARIIFTQYPTLAAKGSKQGRERSGVFWCLAPDPGAIWVRPDVRDPGEPCAVKVYRRRHSGVPECLAYDDDLTARS